MIFDKTYRKHLDKMRVEQYPSLTVYHSSKVGGQHTVYICSFLVLGKKCNQMMNFTCPRLSDLTLGTTCTDAGSMCKILLFTFNTLE